jgi:hypothetical protein
MGHVQRSGLFAEICKLHRSGMGKRKIAKTLGVGKNNTVEIALWLESWRAQGFELACVIGLDARPCTRHQQARRGC